MVTLSVAVLGCGFWSRFQIPAWLELSGVRLIAVCDTNIEKAEATAKRFGIPAVYSDPLDLAQQRKTGPARHHYQPRNAPRTGESGGSLSDSGGLSETIGKRF